MRKTICLFLIAMLFFKTGRAIDFYNGNYQQALAKAKTEHKQIFLYFTAEWCGPCQYMQQYVFPDVSLTRYINQHYVALKVDIDTQDGKLLYIKAHQSKKIMGVPAFILMNSRKEVLKGRIGGMKLSQLQEFLLINQETQAIYKVLADSLAKQLIINQYKKPTMFSKWMFNSMVSNWKPGIKIGLNSTSFKGTPKNNAFTTGYELGFFLNRSFKRDSLKVNFWSSKRYSFEPGLLLTSKGGDALINGINDQVNIHYLELGFFNSYAIKGFRGYQLSVNPYAAIALWGSIKNRQTHQKRAFESDFSKIDYGIKLGLSKDLGNFKPFLGYNIGLKDIRRGLEVARNKGFYLSFAMIIGK